ncbi:MAG TPA: DEDD exonuclease domain-containing protein [Actinomycetota bacterium]|nr:DEDD exonuclease domain-containing protein [Actinomycetota bacterium]
MLAEPTQISLEQGVPLADVTFCVVDLETTGGSPADSRITEIGAVKVRAGERLASFASLVNPQVAIPPFISHLTGIDDFLVAHEPPIEEILPSFVEFVRGCVFVAHNARFDFSFLNAALDRLEYPALPFPPVCTARLARRIVWPEVPNVRLQTLARYFRTRVTPIHRALADAEACAEVLDGLLDLGGRLGILTLGDLHEAVRARGRPHFGKIRMAHALPHAPGVYVFRGREGQVLYVGKSKDLRSRVKSYFYGDERKKVADLLAEVHAVDGIECAGGELEALVLEARLIRRYEPKYNRRGKTWRRFAYLKIDSAEVFPRIKVVHRAAGGDGCTYLGPFANSGRARLAKEALEEAFPVRRCTTAMRARTRFAPCALADMGRCRAPCDGRIDPERYGELVRELLSSLRSPGGLLEALESRMNALAAAERYEEAALARDRLRTLAEALLRHRQEGWLLRAGELRVRVPGGRALRFSQGGLRTGDEPPDPIGSPCPRERADELSAIRSWFAKHDVVVETCDVAPSEPVDGGRAIASVLARARAAELPPVGRARRSLDHGDAGG